MKLDMSKADEPKIEEVPEVVEPKDTNFNLTLSREELEIIKSALAESKNFKTFVRTRQGEAENKLLLGLEDLE